MIHLIAVLLLQNARESQIWHVNQKKKKKKNYVFMYIISFLKQSCETWRGGIFF